MRAKQPKITEVELARDIIAWLNKDGWEVYQEVKVDGPVADIVAKRGPVIWVIEAKVSFGLDVMEQAEHWIHRANMVSVAVPWTKDPHFKKRICSKFGIGVLVRVHEDTYIKSWAIREDVRPEFFRKVITKWDDILREEHKTYCEAGSVGSHKRFTPFEETRQNLIRIVAASPGISLNEALKKFKHHYKSDSSARSCLVDYILKGIISELRIERDGNSILLFLVPKII